MKIKLNPDATKVAEIRQRLKENDGYCPCRISKTDDTKCMCKQFRDSQEEGYCHCELYYKTEKE